MQQKTYRAAKVRSTVSDHPDCPFLAVALKPVLDNLLGRLHCFLLSAVHFG